MMQENHFWVVFFSSSFNYIYIKYVALIITCFFTNISRQQEDFFLPQLIGGVRNAKCVKLCS